MNTDRRSHIRVNLRLQLFLLSPGASSPIRTETEDVSMDGFLCHCAQVYPPGECLKFLLLLPGLAGSPQSTKPMYLKGTVEVVRVTASASGPGFGIGCRLSNYNVFINSDFLDVEEILAALTREDDSDVHLGSPRGAWLLQHR